MTKPDSDQPPNDRTPLFHAVADEPPRRRRTLLVVIGVLALAAAAWIYRVQSTAPEAEPTASAPPPRPEGPDTAPADGTTVHIEGGTFQLGSTTGDADEQPVTEVTVATFDLDALEVSVGAYRRCVEAGRCDEPKVAVYCNWDKPNRERHPINCVDWQQAQAYCAFVGKRLPTEAEWEYAARGRDGRPYPWGTAQPVNQLCWNGEGNDAGKTHRQGTCRVGSYPAGASPFGALDMAGNVWEWTASAYCPYGKPDCGDERRVIRGGSWSNLVDAFVRAMDRAKEKPTAQNDNLGIRCAKTP